MLPRTGLFTGPPMMMQDIGRRDLSLFAPIIAPSLTRIYQNIRWIAAQYHQFGRLLESYLFIKSPETVVAHPPGDDERGIDREGGRNDGGAGDPPRQRAT